MELLEYLSKYKFSFETSTNKQAGVKHYHRIIIDKMKIELT